MALKRNPDNEIMLADDAATQKAKQLFTSNPKKDETMILTTFSIKPSFKSELEDLFSDLGLGWAAGIRFALKEFYKKYKN